MRRAGVLYSAAVDLLFRWDDLPLVTADLPGTGGRIRGEPDDFEVTERPAYLPSGEGEHLYLWVEKRGHTTKFVRDELARRLGARDRDVGVAGLKDRHAVTRQWFSVPRKLEPRLPALDRLEGVRVLDTAAHQNKLGVGHLRGNLFRVRVRDADPAALERAAAVLERLALAGAPNGYGPQRFGIDGRNAEKGLELVRDGRMRGPGSIWLKRFLIGSLQSLLFNRYLALRWQRGLYDALVDGDVAKKHDTGGVFVVEDPKLETPRARALEVSATGPLHGRKLKPPTGAARELEDEVLGAHGLTRESFRDRLGSRRITRILLEGARVEPAEGGYWLEFALPKGSFATVVLREVTKGPVDALAEGEEPGDDEG